MKSCNSDLTDDNKSKIRIEHLPLSNQPLSQSLSHSIQQQQPTSWTTNSLNAKGDLKFKCNNYSSFYQLPFVLSIHI